MKDECWLLILFASLEVGLCEFDHINVIDGAEWPLKANTSYCVHIFTVSFLSLSTNVSRQTHFDIFNVP